MTPMTRLRLASPPAQGPWPAPLVSLAERDGEAAAVALSGADGRFWVVWRQTGPRAEIEALVAEVATTWRHTWGPVQVVRAADWRPSEEALAARGVPVRAWDRLTLAALDAALELLEGAAGNGFCLSRARWRLVAGSRAVTPAPVGRVEVSVTVDRGDEVWSLRQVLAPTEVPEALRQAAREVERWLR